MIEDDDLDESLKKDPSSKFFEDMERLLEENKILNSKVVEQEAIIDDLKNARDYIMKDAYRTLDLNFRLTDSEEKFKKLNAQKDKFFSIIAHDLRNPIANFKELTAVLADSMDELSREDQKDFINDLAKTSKHLYSLLENLLEWARSQTGRISYDPINIHLAQLVDNSFSLLEMSANNKNIALISEISAEHIIYVDPNMINTVVRNLVSNAIKFTPNGGFIRLSAEKSDNFIKFIITDNGVGITEENIDKLFRIDVYTSTRGTNQEKGTGLGLVLCKEFIEKNAGSITVDSIIGVGTSFKVYLPIANQDFHIPSGYVTQYGNIQPTDLKKVESPSVINVKEINLQILDEVITYLEQKLSKYYQEAKNTMVISSIKKFANELISYGLSRDLQFLVDLGQEILKNSEELELDLINKEMEKFPELIEELKKFKN